MRCYLLTTGADRKLKTNLCHATSFAPLAAGVNDPVAMLPVFVWSSFVVVSRPVAWMLSLFDAAESVWLRKRVADFVYAKWKYLITFLKL